MKKYLLEITVFICGAVVMAFEILGSRVFAPFFGTSIFVWTSLIGVILASLSAGYWLGGWLADRKPGFVMLARIIMLAAAFIFLSTILKDLVFNALYHIFPGMIARTLSAAIILFAPASILLGMVSPFAVRLKIRSVNSSGRTVGGLYAIATLGSIVGTFLAGYLLIPLAGTSMILFAMAALLSLLAFLLYLTGRRTEMVSSAIFALVCIAGMFITENSGNKVVEADTRYNHVQIFNTEYWMNGKPIKVMKVNNEYSSAVYLDSDSLVYEYNRYYKLAGHFNPGFTRTLMIGGAAYSYPLFYLREYPHATIDVIELDPGLTELAEEHFGLKEDDRLRIFHEDGRTYINHCRETYDVILVDVFKSQMIIPFQLTTLEAVERMHDLLPEGGLVIMNMVGSIEGSGSAFVKASYRTYSKIFPQVYLFACHDPDDPALLQSISLVALKSPEHAGFSSTDQEIQSYLKTRFEAGDTGQAMILTDELAPAEYLIRKAI